jgi:predicted RNA-binding protein
MHASDPVALVLHRFLFDSDGKGDSNMCEANAYLLKNGEEHLLLEAVDVLENEGNQVKVANIFGEQRVIKGRLRSMSLVNHKIILEELE